MNNTIFHHLTSFFIVAVLLLVQTPASAETYTYDSTGRLTGVTYDNGSTITYTYDNAGNITQRVTDDGNASPSTFTLVSPADGATDLGASVTFVWQEATDPNGGTLTYQFFLCEDVTFTDPSCTPVVVAEAQKIIDYAGADGLLPLVLFGTVLGGIGIRRRKWLMMAIASLALIGLVSGCGGGGGGGGDGGGGGGGPAPTPEKSHTVVGLKPATNYFWKVSVSDGIDTVESATRNFTTL
jgi:YD repeat-containing protein